MKMLTFILIVFCASLNAEEGQHPLKHPKLTIIDVPISCWGPGCIYIQDVMDYIFKTKAERQLATKKLLDAGYGNEKTDFLYIKNKAITINGSVFHTVSDAKDYLKNSKIKRVRVFGVKKKDFPNSIKVEGISFYIVPWDKRDLQIINL